MQTHFHPNGILGQQSSTFYIGRRVTTHLQPTGATSPRRSFVRSVLNLVYVWGLVYHWIRPLFPICTAWGKGCFVVPLTGWPTLCIACIVIFLSPLPLSGFFLFVKPMAHSVPIEETYIHLIFVIATKKTLCNVTIMKHIDFMFPFREGAELLLLCNMVPHSLMYFFGVNSNAWVLNSVLVLLIMSPSHY